ncbi:MAG: hypothetical protein LH469_02360 [Frankiaceae bacterium]|nr:hypothetical protein [Frankiaceae bacterium]
MPDPNDAPGDAPAPRVRRRPRRLAVLVVGLVFLFTPAAASLSGVRATELENRPLAAFPSPSTGWAFFPAVTTWATDHLPLRGLAVSANARVSQDVFGEAPRVTTAPPGAGGPVAPVPGGRPPGERSYPTVLEGRDGWLFFGDDFAAACAPQAPLEQTLDGLERLGELLTAAGKTYVVTIAPDKSTANPDRLPEAYVGDDCAPAAKDAFWERVQQRALPGYVDLKDPLEQARRADGEDLYRPSDTHWGPGGAKVFARQVADALDPALWRSSTPTRTAPVRQDGDLAGLLGTPRQDEVPGWEVVRPGVVVRRADETGLASTTTGAPLWTAPTLVVGDSFTKAALPQLAPLFADARLVQASLAADDADELVAALLAADAVVLELVERSVAAGGLAITDSAFLDRLARALRPAG